MFQKEDAVALKNEGKQAFDALASINSLTTAGAPGLSFEAGAMRGKQASGVVPSSPQELVLQVLEQIAGGGQGNKQDGTAQPMQRQTSLSKPNPEGQLGGLDKIVAGVAKKAMKTQAEQALERGTPPEELYNMALQNSTKSERLNQGTSSLFPGGPRVDSNINEDSARSMTKEAAFNRGEGQSEGQGFDFKQTGDILQTLFSLGTGVPTPGMMRTFGNAKTDVEIDRANRVPLGQADREKLEIEGNQAFNQSAVSAQGKLIENETKYRDEMFKKLLDPVGNSKELSYVESALTGLDNVMNILGISTDEAGNVVIANQGLLKNPNFLSKNRQALKRSREVYINKALRRDSGAVIGKEEEKIFNQTFGFDIGMGSFMKNPEVIAKSLIESQDQLKRDRQNLSPNSEAREFMQFLQRKGMPSSQIKQEMAREGMLG